MSRTVNQPTPKVEPQPRKTEIPQTPKVVILLR